MKCQVTFCKRIAFNYDVESSKWLCMKCQTSIRIARKDGLGAAIKHAIKEGVKSGWDQ